MVWMPVAFAAVIVLGVVGGTLAQTLIKELLPLLRTIAEQKRQEMAPPEVPRLQQTLESIEYRLERLETNQRRLEEDHEFRRQLRGTGSRPAARPSPADAE